MTDPYDGQRKRSEHLKQMTFQMFWSGVVECSELMKKLDPNQRRPWIADIIGEMYEAQEGNAH